MIDITSHLAYIRYNIDDENIVTNDIFINFIANVNAVPVKVRAGYFYTTYLPNEYYTFEGMNELLNGIVTMSSGEQFDFVKKLEHVLELYNVMSLFKSIDIL